MHSYRSKLVAVGATAVLTLGLAFGLSNESDTSAPLPPPQIKLASQETSNFSTEPAFIVLAPPIQPRVEVHKPRIITKVIKTKQKYVKPQPKHITRPKASVNVNGGVWDRIAQCESSGNWSASNPSGKYTGGLQFDRQTWASGGGTKYSSHAGAASKAQQIEIAENIRSKRGFQPWECAGKIGLR